VSSSGGGGSGLLRRNVGEKGRLDVSFASAVVDAVPSAASSSSPSAKQQRHLERPLPGSPEYPRVDGGGVGDSDDGNDSNQPPSNRQLIPSLYRKAKSAVKRLKKAGGGAAATALADQRAAQALNAAGLAANSPTASRLLSCDLYQVLSLEALGVEEFDPGSRQPLDASVLAEVRRLYEQELAEHEAAEFQQQQQQQDGEGKGRMPRHKRSAADPMERVAVEVLGRCDLKKWYDCGVRSELKDLRNENNTLQQHDARQVLCDQMVGCTKRRLVNFRFFHPLCLNAHHNNYAPAFVCGSCLMICFLFFI